MRRSNIAVDLGLALATLVVAALPLHAARPPKDPNVVKGGVLDEIQLHATSIQGGGPVLIRPFSTEGVDLGTGGENAKNEQRSEAAMLIVKTGPEMLVGAFKKELSAGQRFGEILPADAASVPEGALVVEGRFTKIDPGSKAKRYWASFGAGKSGIGVQGSVKDASGKLLAEFTHTRNSGIGWGGGDYMKFLSDDTRDVGRDIARFLSRWAAGESLQKN